MPLETKYTVLLGHQGQVARLIINEAYLQMMHMRFQTTLNKVRQKWQITKGRATVTEIRVCKEQN